MPHSRKRRIGLLAAGVVFTTVLGVILYLSVSSRTKPSQFRLARVERGPIVSTVSSTGTLSAVITVQVGSQVSGQIKALFVDFNSEVKEGQLIARIDSEPFETRVRQAEAELAVSKSNVAIQRASVERARTDLENARASCAAAKAQVEKAKAVLSEAKRNFDRREALIRQNAISKSQMDEATALHDQAIAQLDSAQAQERADASLIDSKAAALRMAQAQVEYAIDQVRQREAARDQASIDLDHTFIRSPVDGVVIERSVDLGQTVAASLQAPKLFTIAQDLREMQVQTNVDEADIGSVQPGQRSTFTVDAFSGREFKGQVEQIRKAPQTIQNVVTYTVIVSAENRDLKLLPGMTANVRILVNERPSALRVLNAALRYRPEGDAGTESIPSPPPSPSEGEPGSGGRASPEELTKRLSEELKLSEDQQARVKEIFSGIRDRIAVFRREGASLEDLRAEIRKSREQVRPLVLAVLTPEQAERYRALVAAREGGAAAKGRVYVMQADGKPRVVELVTGITDGSFTEVIRGSLEVGDQVITGRADTPNKRTGSGRLGF
ncbi:MAG: HlyD family secretion protein [Desulfobacteraceae bacterium]|nr:MAG: HlyD family secretion protein [Desulfobacteraceae bacterium]